MVSRGRRVRLGAAGLAVLGALGLGACASLDSEFACAGQDAVCVDGLVQGTCEPTGYCSFPDPGCPGSGQRYGTWAGAGLGGTCVGAAGDGGIGDGGSTNLLPNPGCENGLDGWSEFQSTLSVSTVAHGGSYSCQACLDSGYTEFTFDDDDQGMSAVYSPQAGQVYRASAWVRSSPGVAAGQQVSLALREWDSQGNPSGRHTFSDLLTLTQSWQYLDVTHTVAADSYALDFFVGNATARAGDCLLADDLAVYLLP